MSTQLRAANGTKYPVSQVFVGGVLDESALEKYGTPQLSGSFAYAMLMANAAVRIPSLKGSFVVPCIICPAHSRRDLD